MSVKIEKISGCKVKLTFQVKAEEFNLALDKAFEKKVQEVNVPGFRKGKLPKSMYISRFGEASLYDEAIDIVVNKAYSEELNKGKLHVVGSPSLDLDFKTVGKDKPLSFTIEVEVWPDVELGQYKEIEVEKESIDVKDEDIDEYVKRILNQHAELEVVDEKVAQKGHTAVFDFEGFVDGVAFDGGKAENYSLELGSGQFIPGFEDQMIGMPLEEEKTIDVTFPEDYHEKSLAGKLAQFKVKIHELKKRAVPELTDEFVKEELEIKDIETKEQYLNYVREVLSKEKEEASNNKFTDDLITKVLDNAKVELPESLIEDEIQYQAKRYGITTELLLQYSGLESLESYKKTIRPTAETTVKERVVFLEIAKVEKIKPSMKEYKDELKKLAAQFKQTEEEVAKHYTKESLTPYLQIQKVIDLIKSTAIVK